MNDQLAQSAISAALESDWEKASRINSTILKSSPQDIDTLNRLGRALGELGQIQKATLAYRKVLRLDKYNQIALKNLQRLLSQDKRKRTITLKNGQLPELHFDFIEEPGKTKVVSLVNLASARTVFGLRPATSILLKPKRHTVVVCLADQKQTYIGSLPDDLGHRLEKLLRGGNTYEGFIKSANKSLVSVFIREINRCPKFRNVSSFSSYPLEKSINREEVKQASEEQAEEEEDLFMKKLKELHADEVVESQTDR